MAHAKLALCAGALLLAAGSPFALAADPQAPADAAAATPIAPLSPEEELATFHVPEGYRMELVLSERDGIEKPVNVTFDGDGRMFVAEMRSYMQDMKGSHQLDPVSRVSRHESTKGDGHYDKHTVFADKLVAPRMVLPLDDRVLINETNSQDINAYRDSTGSGTADQKELVHKGGGRGGNIETQQSGLIWTLDNWCYMTTSSYRLRFAPKPAGGEWFGWLTRWFTKPRMPGLTVRSEPTPSNGGQWGLTQDDYGKLWWSNGGAEIPLYHFQVPILYGAFDVPGDSPLAFDEVFPLVGIGDAQGGADRIRPADGTLNHFTAACGQEIYRGDRLPADLRGDALVCEPVGRLVRRAKVELKDGVTSISNAYPHGEFIRSTDPYFRPVSLANGPDGCLYIVDMYCGIVQEAQWLKPGDYLWGVIKRRGLEKVNGRGRIWRLVHRDFQPGPLPHMLEEGTGQLVAHLEHPNGWWRDTAQKLIVLRADTSVVPALSQLAVASSSPLVRIHALWTLEGLDALNPALLKQLLHDSDAQVRASAIRASESLFKKGDSSLLPEVEALAQDADPRVVLQCLLTGKLLSWPGYSDFAEKTLAATPSKGVRDLGMMALNESASFEGLGFRNNEVYMLKRGATIYRELCFACHGVDGKGMPMGGTNRTLAPPLAGSREVLDSPTLLPLVLLKGLTGPVAGKTYDAQMISMASNDDLWISAIASYVRNSFGNHGSIVTAADAQMLRLQTKDRTAPFTVEELRALVPTPLAGREHWKANASRNDRIAGLAIDGDPNTRWTSTAALREGDWFQIELPAAATISGLRLEYGSAPREFPLGFDVYVSLDGQSWGKPVASGHGTLGIAEAYFTPAPAKYLRVTITRTGKGDPWSIGEFQILAPPGR